LTAKQLLAFQGVCSTELVSNRKKLTSTFTGMFK